MNRIQLDFENVSTLFLAYPEGVVECGIDYTPACSVFDNLINNLPRRLNLVVLVKKGKTRKKIELLRRKNTNTFVYNELSTIWLRDTVGFHLVGSHILKPVFRPKYYRKYFEEAAKIDQYMKLIHMILGIDMVKVPLIWDSGNLVTNGEIGFITEQILIDNKKTHTENQITEIIKSELGIVPIYLPVAPDDPFAHSDGYLAFTKRDTLLVPNYPKKSSRKCLNYIHHVKTIAKKHISNIVEINEHPSNEINKNIPSAKGNYINFLQLGKEIYMPSFGNEELENKNSEILGSYGKVRLLPSSDLARFGGLLHCISFTK
jgi:agmatine/peptidylarginine deiminase